MKVKLPIIFEQDPINFLNFESIDTSDTDNIELHIDCRDFIKEENKLYFSLDFELPNGFTVAHVRHEYLNIYENKYDKIFTICPHTVKKRNEFLGRNLYEYCYYPSPITWTTKNEKIYDLIYAGSFSNYFVPNEIINYNYIVINRLGGMYTNISDVSFQEKLDLISKSKIAIVHNSLPQVNVNSFNDGLGYSHEDFIKVGSSNGGPSITQHKSRVIEAARCRTLLLCRKDSFNIIEDFLTPNVDFIYFDDDNFKDIVDDILANYENYYPMIESAYNKVENLYNIKNFYKDYVQKYGKKILTNI
jgi:hypothetical protein